MDDIIVTDLGRVVAVMVVEECATPDLTGAYNHGVDECPNCGSDNTCVVSHPCVYHTFLPHCYMWYCQDCLLLYEYREVGDHAPNYQTEDSQATRDSICTPDQSNPDS